ncbi:TPA: adhesin [Escherichia coli]|uniref:AfaD family invasin n=1 Tax=Escherichia coli TaxID=562 RepID=UPI0019BB84AC|nr:AfaD family invasin [Escherichia coli]HAM3921900.1 adhesin [Escherichia coli]HAX5125847.1 adhesin [Escherichia coli]HAX5177004.1 adhesin [Escherichia coli]HAX5298131.1 adhesin [Escherichia coli]
MHALPGCLAAVMVMMAGVSQAAELSIDVHRPVGAELQDGERIATGRIICREAHTGFHVWMNAREDERRPGHYLIQGKHDRRHELRVRLDGGGWSVVREGGRGITRPGAGEQLVFDVMADGRQRAGVDEYVFSVSGNCIDNGTSG